MKLENYCLQAYFAKLNLFQYIGIELRYKLDKIKFFAKNAAKNLDITPTFHTFAHAIQNRKAQHFGIWCNGNTTDSGPVILGSSPGIPTKENRI